MLNFSDNGLEDEASEMLAGLVGAECLESLHLELGGNFFGLGTAEALAGFKVCVLSSRIPGGLDSQPPPPTSPGIIRREETSEVALEAVGRRLEGVAKAVGCGYCRLQNAIEAGIRETVDRHRLGALDGAPAPPPPTPAVCVTACHPCLRWQGGQMALGQLPAIWRSAAPLPKANECLQRRRRVQVQATLSPVLCRASHLCCEGG